MQILRAALSSFVLLTGFSAHANTNPFVKINGLLPIYEEFKNSYLKPKFMPFVSIELGTNINKNFKIEIEGMYRSTGLSYISVQPGITTSYSSNLQSYGGFLNAIFKPETLSQEKVYGYIGGGVGYMSNKVDSVNISFNNGFAPSSTPGSTTSALSYQIFLGASYEFKNKVFCDASLRFINFGSAKYDGTSTGNIYGAHASIGLGINL